METRTIFNAVVTYVSTDVVEHELKSFNNEDDAKHFLYIKYNEIVERDKKEKLEYKTEIVDRVDGKKELDYFYLEVYWYGEKCIGEVYKTELI